MTNEEQIRHLIENWAEAVRHKNIDNILAYHSEDFIKAFPGLNKGYCFY